MAGASDLLEALLHRDRERRADSIRLQKAGPCTNPEHDHPDGPPARILFAGYWLCPHDEVLTPQGRAGGMAWTPIGELTTRERDKLERNSGIRRKR